MVVNDNRPSKRLKRRVTAGLYDFLSFPSSLDVAAGETFRSSVESFLSKHAKATFAPSLFPCLVTWQILLRVGDLTEGLDCSPVVVAFDVVEEDVTRSTRSVYCDQCRVVGWSGHPVCRKRYHFIIRANSSTLNGYQKACSRCGNQLQLSESRCKSCNMMTTADDLEDWVYNQFDDNTHLLHGVVHSNGYGHLLTVNGREGGSKVISGSDIMNFWDRLCKTLAVRKVTVMDVSKKYGMEYRLLHSVAQGCSWYGNWGYEFGTGSYAVTVDAYREAVESLSGMLLAPLLHPGRKPRTRLQDVIAFYQSLSEFELLTMKELFLFLLGLVKSTRERLKCGSGFVKSDSKTCTVLCAWSRNDVERVQQALVKVLTAAIDGQWFSSRCLKGALCKVALPELLEYSIKHLAGTLTPNGKVVRARCNPNTSAVEYRLEPLIAQHHGMRLNKIEPSEVHVRNDIRFLYDCLLHPQTMVNYSPEHTRDRMVEAATKLIDCKQFMKDYKPNSMGGETDPNSLLYWCHVDVSGGGSEEPVPPPELVVLPMDATVTELKNEVAKVYQEVYPVFKKFQVEKLPEYGNVEDSMTLKILIGLSGDVRTQGECRTKHGLARFRMERGTEIWRVDCVCGTKDDDGEPMLACDACGVWQHQRCVGIESSDAMPAKFVCIVCARVTDESRGSGCREKGEGSFSVPKETTCRGDAMPRAGPAIFACACACTHSSVPLKTRIHLKSSFSYRAYKALIKYSIQNYIHTFYK